MKAQKTQQNISIPTGLFSQRFGAWQALAAALFLSPLAADGGESVSYSGKESKNTVTIQESTDWKDSAVGPVTNVVWFEDPRVFNSIRPAYIFHRVDDGFTAGGAKVNITGAQIRLALTERLALIVTDGVYIHFNPETGESQDGISNLGGGFKYVLIDDVENQFILTPQLTFLAPTGNRDVFQGYGDGEINAAVSIGKGFDKLLFLANVGVRVPLDQDVQVNQLHYSFHASYRVSEYFIPLVEVNGYTNLSDADKGWPLNTNGADLINFGAGDSGETQLTLAAGFRSKLAKNVTFGAAYEIPLTSPKGFFEDRVTVDLEFRF